MRRYASIIVLGLALACLTWPACAADGQNATPRSGRASLAERRAAMTRQIRSRGITDEALLSAFDTVPRHVFVPETQRAHAYEDRPLPIGEGQTISQPYIVALMTDLAGVRPGHRVLEVGTGSGYQAAILAALKADVYTIEIVPALAARARRTLEGLGVESIHYRVGDGYRGWPEAAPFDAIIVTAAPDHVPQPLVEQLAPGGRLIIPVGDVAQTLTRITRTDDGIVTERVVPVRFVPMTGEARERP